MATIKETGKGRSRRIEIDYYKKPDPIRKLRAALVWAAIILAGGWLLAGLTFSNGKVSASAQSRFRSSPGELASVHKAWNDRCEACHNVDISSSGKSEAGGWPVPGVETSLVTDTSCQSCHSGPAHHPSQKPEDVKSCASCHFDHRGVDNSLIKLADSDCISCHKDLSQHIASGKQSSGTANVVTSFTGDHPPFSTESDKAVDPGRLKFNHALHLSEGLVHKPGDRDVKTLAYLTDPTARERYRKPGQKDDAPIRLDCASCHVADASDFKLEQLAGLPRATTLPVRSQGKEMLPITYENQCKACHPLSFDGRNPKLVAPHRAQPEDIRQFLTSTYSGVFVSDDQKLLADVPQKKPIPGQRADRDEASVKQRIDKAVAAAEKVLYGGKTTCFECHYATKTTAAGLPEAIELPNVPSLWQPKARFDHTAHRAVKCAECHVKSTTSIVASDILVPGIASCRECHVNAKGGNLLSAVLPGLSSTESFVRADCTTCHRYHHADKPMLGRGASSERGTVDHDFAKFLSGDHSK